MGNICEERETTAKGAVESIADGARRPKARRVFVDRDTLPLARAFHWERERSGAAFMVQPVERGDSTTFTWGRAMAEARRMAAYLRSLNLPVGSAIAILSKNCAHVVMMDLAIWMAGHVSVILYPTLGPETIRMILDHCEARVLFVGKLDAWERQRTGVPSDLRCIACALSPATSTEFTKWEDIVAGTEPLRGTVERAPDETALLIYTSGSTGRPKGVEHDFISMSAAALGFDGFYKLSTRDRMLSHLPLAHAFERAAAESTSLLFGFTLFFAESPATFVDDLRRARPTIFYTVPRIWAKLRDGILEKVSKDTLHTLVSAPIVGPVAQRLVLSRIGLHRTRVAITGSAPIQQELADWYRELGLELLEGYAMTENFTLSHCTPIGGARKGSVGMPAPDVEARIGPEGEVLVKSPATMKGYYKDPELTLATFTPDGFLRTGDCGSIDADGYLFLQGRKKEIFKTSKGKFVAPASIEISLDESGLIESACVMGAGEVQPFAVVTLTEAARARLEGGGREKEVEEMLQALLSRVNGTLQPWERLSFLFVVREAWTVENGLMTPTMKIRRFALEKLYGETALAQRAEGRRVVFQA